MYVCMYVCYACMYVCMYVCSLHILILKRNIASGFRIWDDICPVVYRHVTYTHVLLYRRLSFESLFHTLSPTDISQVGVED